MLTSSVRVFGGLLMIATLLHGDQRLQNANLRSMVDWKLRTSADLHQPDVGESTDDDATKQRTLDRVSGTKSQGEFEKREFDRIDGMSALGGLQKRHFDHIESGSSLGGLIRKRQQQHYRYYNDDENSQSSEKRSFDMIGDLSSMGGLETKRTFDRIGEVSALGGLEKKNFDQIGEISSLGGLAKRSTAGSDGQNVERELVHGGGKNRPSSNE